MTKLSLEVREYLQKTITTIIKSAVDNMENRLFKRILVEVQSTKQYEPVVEHQTLNVVTRTAKPMDTITFERLSPGTIFRLWTGSQPLLKLEPPKQSWQAPMPYEANAFYIKTGSTVKVPAQKEVVPLKSTITIDDEK